MMPRRPQGNASRRRTSWPAVAGLVPVLLLAACGSDGPPRSADFGNLLNSPEGLVLVDEEHPTGWGRPDCFTCHEVRDMHTVNRTGLPGCDEVNNPAVDACVDLAEIQQIIRNEGGGACVRCHGENGVAP